MHIAELYLNNYRNLAEQRLSFSPEVNFISGNNAQGKTNLLEAIAYLAQGKSFRGNKNSELISFTAEQAYLEAEICSKITSSQFAVTFDQNKNRQITIDDKKISSLTDLFGKFLCVAFIPSDLSIVQGEPAVRRRFIDSVLSIIEPAYLRALIKYNQALKNKNFLLKNRQATTEKINAWNKILAETTTTLYRYKLEFISGLQAQLTDIYSYFTAFDGDLSLNVSNELLLNADYQNAGEIYEQLQEQFQKECIMKRSLLGPHKDDLQINLADQVARNFASQGQSRSLSLALKFSVVELIEQKFGDSPVVLLDDLDSELDTSRAQKLFELIFSKKRQVIITGTELRNNRLLPEDRAVINQLKITGGVAKSI